MTARGLLGAFARVRALEHAAIQHDAGQTAGPENVPCRHCCADTGERCTGTPRKRNTWGAPVHAVRWLHYEREQRTRLHARITARAPVLDALTEHDRKRGTP